jgi:hypothetical protein
MDPCQQAAISPQCDLSRFAGSQRLGASGAEHLNVAADDIKLLSCTALLWAISESRRDDRQQPTASAVGSMHKNSSSPGGTTESSRCPCQHGPPLHGDPPHNPSLSIRKEPPARCNHTMPGRPTPRIPGRPQRPGMPTARPPMPPRSRTSPVLRASAAGCTTRSKSANPSCRSPHLPLLLPLPSPRRRLRRNPRPNPRWSGKLPSRSPWRSLRNPNRSRRRWSPSRADAIGR